MEAHAANTANDTHSRVARVVALYLDAALIHDPKSGGKILPKGTDVNGLIGMITTSVINTVIATSVLHPTK